jgi:hypothetical protein
MSKTLDYVNKTHKNGDFKCADGRHKRKHMVYMVLPTLNLFYK